MTYAAFNLFLPTVVIVISLGAVNARHTSERLECEAKYEYALESLCTYPQQQWPCFIGSKLHDDRITHTLPTKQITNQCCDVHCSLEDLHKFYCCHTPECLQQCYGHPRSYASDFLLLKK
ncbi:hypothetical protein AAVH_10383 [Aphelenchoides avenae]|nr:hypothetical protein AAVH_10383 [Aphelenchus avenae]